MTGFASFQIPDFRDGLVVIGFGLFMIFLAALYIRKVRQLSFDEEYLYIRNFRAEEKVALHRVKSLNESNMFDPFFEIEFYPVMGSIRKIDFLPPIA